MKKVRFGVVGVGGMGGGHARSIPGLEECELAAVTDVNEETAQRVAGETGARAFTDYKQMLRKAELDAVLIATPHYFHPPVAEFAAKQGVHVLSEKPIAVSVAAADKMVNACRENNVLLGVMFQQRTEAFRLAMKRIIDAGELGEIHRISMSAPWYRPQAYYDSGAWRGTWKGEGGGILMNQAPHSLDQFLWLGGQPKKIQAIASTRLHQIEVENTSVAIADYGDGKIGWFHASTSEVPGGERIEVAGDKGVLVFDGKLRFYELDEPLSQHLTTSTEKFGSPSGKWRDVEYDKADASHSEVTKAFARAVSSGDASQMIADGEDGLRALELANAILLAGYTRREVELPLSRSRYERMLKQLQKGEFSPA
jgi:predicted dehydrogenase